MKNRRIVLFLMISILLLGICGSASAEVASGSVRDGVFDNKEGISFTVPKGFTVVEQTNKSAGFFRIALEGKQDLYGFAPAMVVDIYPGAKNISSYKAADFREDIVRHRISWGDDTYSDFLFLNDDIINDNGYKTREMFLICRLERWGSTRNSYTYGLCFSTRKSFVRIYYSCFGSQQSMVTDIEGARQIYNTLIVP